MRNRKEKWKNNVGKGQRNKEREVEDIVIITLKVRNSADDVSLIDMIIF